MDLDTNYRSKLTILALSAIRGIGYFTLREIYDRLARIEDIWTLDRIHLNESLARLSKDKVDLLFSAIHQRKSQLSELASEQYQKLLHQKISFLLSNEPLFPTSLLPFKDSPKWLFVEGDPTVLRHNQMIALVGSREANEQSIRATKVLTQFLTDHRYAIVSGLAEGIDATAHDAAIRLKGKTVAVLGHGINHTFPASTAGLRQRIKETGNAVISEFLPKESYNRHYFLWRNRLQSALSIAVVPIECKANSGTARTIRYAIEQKRKLFTIRLKGEPQIPGNDVYDILRDLGKPVFNFPSEEGLLLAYLARKALISDSSHEEFSATR